MRNRIAALLCSLVLLAGVPLALSAQLSYTYTATQGLFLTDVDNAFDLSDYSMLGGRSLFFADLGSSGQLDLAYARNYGSMYLLLNYAGTLVGFTSNDNKSFNTTELLAADNSVIGTRQTVTETLPQSNGSSNSIGALIGLGKLGIGVGVYENVNTTVDNYSFGGSVTDYNLLAWSLNGGGTTSGQSNTTTPAATGTAVAIVNYTPATNGSINVQPSVSVGTTIVNGDMTLKPYAKITATIYDNTQAANRASYTQDTGSGLAAFKGLSDIGAYTSYDYSNKNSYIDLNAKLGSRMEKGAWKFDLKYTFDMPLFTASYIGTDGSTKTNAKGPAIQLAYTNYTATLAGNTTTTGFGYQANAETNIYNNLQGTAQYTLAFNDRINFALGINPYLYFNSTKNVETGAQVTTSVVTNYATPTSGSTTVYTKDHVGPTVANTSFGLTPQFSGAMQYSIVPKVLTMNLGTTLTLENMTSSTTTTTRPGYDSLHTVVTNYDGTVATDTYTSTLGSARPESRNSSFSLNNLSTGINWGFNWVLADGVALDTLFGTNSSSAIFQTYYFSLQLSIKK